MKPTNATTATAFSATNAATSRRTLPLARAAAWGGRASDAAANGEATAVAAPPRPALCAALSFSGSLEELPLLGARPRTATPLMPA
jgi:hypothetical protein